MSQLSQEQREARSKGIGGSEAAIVCGLSPWKTPVQLWQEKTGRVPEPNLDDNELVLWGNLLEDTIATEYARRQQVVVHRVNDTRIHPDHDFMLAHIDRRIVGAKRGLEVKNASLWTAEKWGESGTDDVPLFYLTQCVHYMAVFDYPEWDVGVLLGGNELRNYRVHRDVDSEKRLIELERAFWECVQKDKPPPAIRVEDLVRLYPSTQGRKVATEDVALLVEEYARINVDAKAIDKRKDEIKLAIGTYMGEAGDLIDPHDAAVTIATYRSHPESRIDSKKLRAEHPDVAAQVEKQSNVRKFLVK